MASNQIFFDPTGRRRHIVNALLVVFALAATTAVVTSIVSVLQGPVLPALVRQSVQLPPAEALHAASADEAVPTYALGTRPLPANAVSTWRLGFYDPSDAASNASLRRHARELDGVLAQFLSIGRQGQVETDYPRIEKRMRAWLRAEASGVEVLPILAVGQRPADAAAALARPADQARITRALADYLHQNGDAGVVIDPTGLPASSHADLVKFALAVTGLLRPAGRRTILIAPAGIVAERLREMASVVDHVVLSTHRNPSAGHRSRSLASQGWFERELARNLAVIPRAKAIVSIGAYALDTSSDTHQAVLPVQHAWSLAASADATSAFDTRTLNSGFRYVDAADVAHAVSLLDGVTVFNHLRSALVHQPAGVALWRLGLEDPSAWSSFGRGRLPDAAAAKRLQYLEPGDNPQVPRHRTEIAYIDAAASDGHRQVTYDDALGLVVASQLEKAPTSPRFADWAPRDSMMVALTFDDGPHDKITPAILDILTEKRVKATFFVVGRNALQNPDVLRRAYRDGHDIGNHTLSHRHLHDIGETEVGLEIAGGQRVLEGLLGIHTRLFRPPYSGTALPDDPETIRIIARASTYGYVSVLGGVQPSDWLNPPASVIHDRVVSQVAAAKGQIVVLHDWGQRQSTLDALPAIIETLQARGYRFVTVHEMLGRPRSELMPVVTTGDMESTLAAAVRQASFVTLNGAAGALPMLAMIGSILSISRLIFVVVSVRRHRRLEFERAGNAYWPSSVAVLVPAYNEATVIAKTIASLLASADSRFDIIVVDDGSTDGTAKAALAAFGHEPRVRVFSKPNGGKAAAANFALTKTDAEIVIAMDADTVFRPDTIPLLVRHFRDPLIGAVAGTAVVGNQVNLLTRFQAVEYTIGQYLDRRAFALFNANGIVPGAIGAWRRAALVGAGGYASDTLAEDADATFAVIRAGWTVAYEPAAEAFTEAPETLKSFLKQRYRWMFGMLQVLTKHAGAVFDRRTRGLGLVMIPNVIVFQFGFSFLVPILDVVALWHIGAAAVDWTLGSEGDTQSSGLTYLVWWGLLLCTDILAMALALSLAAVKDVWRIVPLLLAQRVLYWPMIYWTAALTLLAALKGRVVGWGKLHRTGSVSLPQNPGTQHL